MHWNVELILWALVLAAHLVLLIVLLGRDRAGRFPWFTAAIAVSAARLLADHLLHGKLTSLAFYWQSYSAMVLDALLGILVLIELTRIVFNSGKAGIRLNERGWIGWGFVPIGIAGLGIWMWGPWPTWKSLSAEPGQLPLLLTVLGGMKGELLLAMLTVQIGLLLRIFGKRFGFGWRSQVQQIALGLSTNALGLLAVQGISDGIKHSVHLTTRAEYDRVLKLLTNIDNARVALWFLVLAWWIVWLWRDEPGEASGSLVEAPVMTGPPEVEGKIEIQD